MQLYIRIARCVDFFCHWCSDSVEECRSGRVGTRPYDCWLPRRGWLEGRKGRMMGEMESEKGDCAMMAAGVPELDRGLRRCSFFSALLDRRLYCGL